jgi:peroxiredoxin Q/BCP
MRLHPGSPAPPFRLPDAFGQLVDLVDFRHRPVHLSFFRYASCPMCNLRMRELVLAHRRLSARGLVQLAVFQSPAASLVEYIGPHDAPFSLIPDPEMALYRLYGVERGMLGLLSPKNVVAALRAFRHGHAPGRIDGPLDRMPAEFLIAPGGRIDVAFYASRASEHLALEDIDAWLAGSPQRPQVSVGA